MEQVYDVTISITAKLNNRVGFGKDITEALTYVFTDRLTERELKLAVEYNSPIPDEV